MERDSLVSAQRHIGIIGGTFDPIHYGHLIIAEEVRTTLSLAEIVLIPAGQPFHKPGRVHTPIHHRLAMIELAIASNPHFTISHIEINHQEPSYLIDTLRILHRQCGPATDLSFIIGWDNLVSFHAWHKPLGILAQLTYLVVVQRPRYVKDIAYIEQLETRLPGISRHLLILSTPQIEISSTDLRQRITEGRPVKYQLPEAVEHYIYEHGLYRV